MGESPVQRYVELILRQRPDLSREEVLGRIESKKAEAAVSERYREVWAALMVAHDLGVDLEERGGEEELSVGDLSPGMSGVSLTVRVVAVLPQRLFTGREGTAGRYLRMVVGDASGWVVLILWRDRVDLAEREPTAGRGGWGGASSTWGRAG